MPKNLPEAELEALRKFEEAGTLEMVGRNCRLLPYDKIEVPAFRLSGDFIAYASPESTYPVTKNLIDGAEKSILIGIYDFTAGYMKEKLLKAMQRGVKVSLMLDLDGRSGETEIFDELVKFGCDGVPAPSCASQSGAKYFSSSHEKVVVIDDEWCMVQSGNYSDNSIPENEVDGGDPDNFVPGNRDMGVAIKSKPLAKFFTKVLRSDMKLEIDGPAPEGVAGLADLGEAEMLEAAPAAPPPKLFHSKKLNPAKDVKVTPILSPDNYMDVIPGFLESATKSICIEQQYIRGKQEEIGKLLAAIRAAMDRNEDLDVRIVLAKPFPGKRFDKEAGEIKALGKDFGLKLGKNVRILNPKFFVHCHNKLIIVDRQAVLVSSQNWSDSAVAKNREAGLLMEYPQIAAYYASIFDVDWETGLKTLAKKSKPEFFAPQALSSGKVVPLAWGDYVEV